MRGPDGEDQRVELHAVEGGRRVLTDDEVVEVARLGLATEAHYGSPQDTEWAMAGGHTYLVQSRPVTAVGGGAAPSRGRRAGHAARAGPRGVRRAGLGRRCGCCSTPDQGDRLQAGEVLVAPMTSPDWVPTMRRAAALVTDGGGMTCHAAIVSRELGVPRVVGARNATTVLRDGELVTVDGAQGTVHRGRPRRRVGRPIVGCGARTRGRQAVGGPGAAGHEALRNLAFAEHAEEVAALPVDGVGLLRAEFMVTDALGGVHPRKLLSSAARRRRSSTAWPSRCCASRGPSSRGPSCTGASTSAPTSSPTSRAATEFEPHEENPMIGYRGCYRYVREPDLFRLELDVLAPVLRGDAEHRADDPLRAHRLGARGLPRGGRRQPGRRSAARCG